MKKLLVSGLSLAVVLALSSLSMADVIDNSGAGYAFPDNDPAGASSSITIGADEVITDVDVTLFGTTHTWVGDLIVSLEGPDGTSVDLMFRTGDTTGGVGDSSDLGADYTFSDGGDDWWAAADLADGADIIAGGVYAPTTVNGDASFLSSFAGMSTAGTWTLTASDNAGGDLGGITGWGLSIESAPAIPEPGSIALLGAFGVALVARRRR